MPDLDAVLVELERLEKAATSGPLTHINYNLPTAAYIERLRNDAPTLIAAAREAVVLREEVDALREDPYPQGWTSDSVRQLNIRREAARSATDAAKGVRDMARTIKEQAIDDVVQAFVRKQASEITTIREQLAKWERASQEGLLTRPPNIG